MQVLFVNPIADLGGAERVLLSNLQALSKTCPDWKLALLLFNPGPLQQLAEELGVEVQILPLSDRLRRSGNSQLTAKPKIFALGQLLFGLAIALPELLNFLSKLQQTLQTRSPDLIHSHGIKTHLLLALSSPSSVPVIWHLHDYYGSRPLIAKVLGHFCRRARSGIAISKSVAADARSSLPDLPVTVLYNTIDVDRFAPSPLQSPPQSLDPIRIGLVATFARWKGQDLFLEAAAQIFKERPDQSVRFYIVGGAIYQTQGSQWSLAELQDKAASLGIEDQVEFLGFQTDVIEIYRWLDIVVHASIQPEPFGLAIAEAMSCGKPVIVAQSGGAAELFTHNQDAYGVPPGDRLALATAMQYLMDHPQERARLGQHARQTVMERFNADRLGEQLLAVYNSVMVAESTSSSRE